MNLTIIHLDFIPSTNSYAHELQAKEKVVEGHVIWTDFQEKGKG